MYKPKLNIQTKAAELAVLAGRPVDAGVPLPTQRRQASLVPVGKALQQDAVAAVDLLGIPLQIACQYKIAITRLVRPGIEPFAQACGIRRQTLLCQLTPQLLLAGHQQFDEFVFLDRDLLEGLDIIVHQCLFFASQGLQQVPREWQLLIYEQLQRRLNLVHRLGWSESIPGR